MPNSLAEHIWIAQVFGIVFATLIVNFVVVAVLRRFHRRLAKTHNIWDDTLVQAMIKPLGWLIWVTGLALAARLAAAHLDGNLLTSMIEPVRDLLILVLVLWFCIRFISGVEGRAIAGKGEKKWDKTTVIALAQLLRAATVITAVLIGMQTFGVPISGVLAFGGMGGIAIGFAAKDLLGNFFGGLMIFMDRPFAVGDWIRSPDKNIEGTVEHIGWRLTRIRTFDKRPLFVPNGIFSTISVENPSRMTNRRIKTLVGLRYDDAGRLGAIIEDVEKMLREHPEIDTHMTLFAKLVEFGPSSLNFQIYTFTKTTNWVKFQAVQQDVFLKVIDIIESHGAEIAFPTTTLHVPEGVSLSGAKL